MKDNKQRWVDIPGVVGVLSFSNQVLYMLTRELKVNGDQTVERQYGLSLFNMQTYVTKKQIVDDKSILIKELEIGGMDVLFEFTDNANRLGFIRCINEIIFCPLLHINEIRFSGLADFEDYILTKDISDSRYTALSKKNVLSTWCSLSGKLLTNKVLDHLQL